MRSVEVQASNPMTTVKTQTSKVMTDALVQVGSQLKNPKCPTCGKGLSTHFSLARHRGDVHKENVMSATEKNIKECKKKI